MEFDTSVYINAEDGAKRVGGNMGLYKKLLARFAEGNYIDQLASEIASGNMDGAAAAAHTIKGVAANLSLVKVNELSAALESAFKNGQPYDELFSELKAASAETIERINAL